jgi:hypothetical protein
MQRPGSIRNARVRILSLGMRKRIDDEVPKWRDIVAKAGLKPV